MASSILTGSGSLTLAERSIFEKQCVCNAHTHVTEADGNLTDGLYRVDYGWLGDAPVPNAGWT